jgi:demethylmenaquinone methyltransferase/2-methoxy-6-polyprenyl-1,4-benzoquinol methylase
MTESQTATSENPTKCFYDRISSAYDVLADSGEHKARQRGLEALAVQSGEKVLEIGYGTGHSLVELAQAVGPQGKVYGVDISEGMRDQAKLRVRRENLEERVELAVAVTPPLPYEDEPFDAVAMSFTLELFPLDVIPAELAEIRRVLRPGGRLGVTAMATVKEGATDSMLERTYKWMHLHFPHIVDCQPINAVKFIQDAGFEIVETVDMTIWTMPVVAVVGKK